MFKGRLVKEHIYPDENIGGYEHDEYCIVFERQQDITVSYIDEYMDGVEENLEKMTLYPSIDLNPYIGKEVTIIGKAIYTPTSEFIDIYSIE